MVRYALHSAKILLLYDSFLGQKSAHRYIIWCDVSLSAQSHSEMSDDLWLSSQFCAIFPVLVYPTMYYLVGQAPILIKVCHLIRHESVNEMLFRLVSAHHKISSPTCQRLYNVSIVSQFESSFCRLVKARAKQAAGATTSAPTAAPTSSMQAAAAPAPVAEPKRIV